MYAEILYVIIGASLQVCVLSVVCTIMYVVVMDLFVSTISVLQLRCCIRIRNTHKKWYELRSIDRYFI